MTAEKGKMVTIAKGVKKLTSRKRAALEVFSNVLFQSTQSHSLSIITEVRLENGYIDLRTDLRKVAVAYYCCEVVKKITAEDEPNHHIYQLLLKTLSALEKATHTKAIKDRFTWEILEVAGFITAETTTKDPQKILEEVLERSLGSVRVGRMLQ